MIRQLISAVLALASVIAAAYWYMGHERAAEQQHTVHDADYQEQDDHAMQEQPKGPNGGRLLSKKNFVIEITIFENGVDPEFRVYAYQQQQPLDPSQVDVTIDLERIDGEIDRFDFKAKNDYLRSEGIVTEPHSFIVHVNAQYEGKSYEWQYDSIEGRTQIPAEIAAEAGIKTASAGPGVISEYLPVTGHLVQVPDKQSSVRAAYPGIVKSVSKRIGERVKKGAHLLTIQNSSSLQNYTVTAPISGVVIERNVQQGESTNGEVLFVIADLDQLWVELDIFSKDFNKVKTGQT
ncbi:MAG: efflux RND transporter periplasmic adaptor subunit, partial [Gammaproteobacteria bacterium]